MFDLEETRIQAAVTAMNKMLRSSYFDICTVDSVAKMLGIETKRDSYNILRTLHCVHYNEMPIELRNKIPMLIADALDNPPPFQFTQPTKQVTVLVADVVGDKPARKSPFRLPWGGK